MKTAIKYFLKSISNFTKEGVSFQIEGETLDFKACEKIAINPSFFKEFICKRCCVCCQKGISPLVYSDSDVTRMKECHTEEGVQKLTDGLREFPIQVNGETKNLFLYEFSGYRCGFDKLMEGDDIWGCQLHFLNLKQLLCLLPWVRIIDSRGCVNLGKRPFGYSWAFGCRAQWGREFSEEQFLDHDLVIIQRMIDASNDLGISTYLPEVMEKLQDWHKKYKEGKAVVPQTNLVVIDLKNKDKKFFI